MKSDAEVAFDASEMSQSYLRIRQKLTYYGAFATNVGGEDRFRKTEDALDLLLAYSTEMEDKLTQIENILDINHG